MKKILMVDYPDEFPVDMLYDTWEKYSEYGISVTEVTLPSEIMIDAEFPTYDEQPEENVHRAEGARWFKSQIINP